MFFNLTYFSKERYTRFSFFPLPLVNPSNLSNKTSVHPPSSFLLYLFAGDRQSQGRPSATGV